MYTDRTHTLLHFDELSQTNQESEAVTDLVSVAEKVGVSVAPGLGQEQPSKNYTQGNLSEPTQERVCSVQERLVGTIQVLLANCTVYNRCFAPLVAGRVHCLCVPVICYVAVKLSTSKPFTH